MNIKKVDPIALVLLCALAVIFGIICGATIFKYSNEEVLVGNVEELSFSENLLNNEMKVIIEKINTTYPGSVKCGNGKVVLLGDKAIDEFDTLSVENGVEMNWEFVPVPAGAAVFIQDVQDVNSQPSESYVCSQKEKGLLIRYEELDQLLKGDPETLQSFRKILYESGWNFSEWNKSETSTKFKEKEFNKS
ncbi:MAG: hypothetical protein PHD41_07655 [Methanosarcinaceae archaeon]|nr:hypothetical protein [Methanosarcinaceae archaeon]MDD4331250.1 hypothetical protein [Methanosarcinaceae archaeon]MDD4748891.1 hypothetical protein [Methanosarcinaceae archaeon]